GVPEMGAGVRRATTRHVRLRDLGRGGTAALLRTRPIWDQAPLLHGRRRRFHLRVGDEGTPAVLAVDRNRRRRLTGLPRFPVLPGRENAISRHLRVAAGAYAHRARPRAVAPAVLG